MLRETGSVLCASADGGRRPSDRPLVVLHLLASPTGRLGGSLVRPLDRGGTASPFALTALPPGMSCPSTRCPRRHGRLP